MGFERRNMTHLEKQEIASRIRNASREEQMLIASELPHEVMIDEIRRRHIEQERAVKSIKDILHEIALDTGYQE